MTCSRQDRKKTRQLHGFHLGALPLVLVEETDSLRVQADLEPDTQLERPLVAEVLRLVVQVDLAQHLQGLVDREQLEQHLVLTL